jgi:hypothetical protein
MNRLIKYPKIKVVGSDENRDIFKCHDDEIIIEEKIDGANFRFMLNNIYDENRIIFGSRGKVLGYEHDTIGGVWERCVKFIKDTVKVRDFTDMVIFGECCHKHTMNYDWEKIPPFLGFDIWNINDGSFLDYNQKKYVFDELGLTMVPLKEIIRAGDIKEITTDIIPQSQYANTYAEGVVFKNYKRQIFAKFVSDKFKEDNRKVFGGGKKHAETDTHKLVLAYCTNPRVEKWVFKLIDEGHKLNRSLMKHLPKLVLEDIYQEHGNDIWTSAWTVDFKKMRQQVSKRCFAVLDTMIVNNALQ